MTDRDIVRREAVRASALPEIPRYDILPIRGAELISIFKKAGDLEATAADGTILSEERPVTWWKSDTQCRLGLRDGRFGGTACDDARCPAFGAHQVWWMSRSRDWLYQHLHATLEAWVIHGTFLLRGLAPVATHPRSRREAMAISAEAGPRTASRRSFNSCGEIRALK